MTAILITSVSRKIPLLKCLKQSLLRENLIYRLIGADSDANALAQYFVDQFWNMPLLTDLSENEIISYCQKHHVKMIIPTRDAELEYFAERKSVFSDHGIYIMVSDLPVIQQANDKLAFYLFLQRHSFPTIFTTENFEQLSLLKSIVVKERSGQGSKHMLLNIHPEQWDLQENELQQPIFQPYIEGIEYSVDTYVDLDGNCKGVVVRSRDYIVDGESQITTVISHKAIETLIKNVAEALRAYGHIMFQVLIDKQGQPHIIECNPRFGGASTLSIAAGLNSFVWFVREAEGEPLDTNKFQPTNLGLKMIRHLEDLIF